MPTSCASANAVIAVNHDTSVTMLERTHSRYTGDHADA
jgi:hypothetical protein